MLAVASALVVLPASTQAQSTWDLTFGAGIANPVSDLNDSWGIGANVNVAGTYWFQDRLGFRLETSVDVLSGDNFDSTLDLPDLNLWHFGGGLEYSVTDRASDALSVIVNGGGGLTWMDGDATKIATTTGNLNQSTSFSEVYGHLNGGLSVGWPLSDNITIAVNGSVYVAFADKTDTATIAQGISPFDSAVTFPVGLTLRLHL